MAEADSSSNVYHAFFTENLGAKDRALSIARSFAAV
jgi:hypothetical protein